MELKLNYNVSVKIKKFNNSVFEIKTTSTGNFWAIYKDGQKQTDFMVNPRLITMNQIRSYCMRKFKSEIF